MKRALFTLLFVVFTAISMLYGVTFISAQSGYWDNPATWGISGQIPGAADDVYISSGHTVWVDSYHACGMLTLAEGNFGPAVLSCVDYGSATLYVGGSIDIQTDALGGNCAITKGNGTLNIQVGYNITVRQRGYYMPTTSTFIGNTEGNRCILEKQSGSVILTDFYASSYDMYYFIVGNADYGYAGQRSTFNSTRLTSNLPLDFGNVSFTSCQIGNEPYGCNTSYTNCHFTGCVVSNTATMIGLNAILDNDNYFENLTVNYEGSIFGNIEMSSVLHVSGDIVVNTGGWISYGDWGTLAVYVGGDLHLEAGSFYEVDETFFNGARTLSNPQYLYSADQISGHLSNNNSAIRLASHIYLADNHNFVVGTLDLDEYHIHYANVSGGTISANPISYAILYNCDISSVTFVNQAWLSDCRIMDSNVSFNSGLNSASVVTADYTDITVNITGPITLYESHSFVPGTESNLIINLDGDLMNYGTLGPGTLNFIGSSVHYLVWDASDSVFHVDINNNCPDIRFTVYGGTVLNLNGKTITGDSDHFFSATGGYTLANGNLVGFTTTATPYTTTLHNVTLTNCEFNNEVIVTGENHLLSRNCEFYDQLTVSGYLYGMDHINSVITIEDLIVQDTGRFLPGEQDGQLSLDCYGSSIRIEDTGEVDFNDPLLDCTDLRIRVDNCNLYVEGFVKGSLRCMGNNIHLQNSFDGRFVGFGGSGTLNLNGYTLTSGAVNYISVINGNLSSVRSDGSTFTDVSFMNFITLWGDENVFAGACHNYGEIHGDEHYQSVTFTTQGTFYNEVQGTIVPAAGREIVAVVEGSVYNYNSDPDAWVGEVHLSGNDPRTLDFGVISADISVTDGAEFSLEGTNTIPELTINTGCTVTIPALSSLVFTEIDGWYSGNLVVYGSVTNSRSADEYMMPFHKVYMYPSENIPEGMITTMQHVYGGPNHLPGSTLEYWKMSSSSPYPEGYTTELKFAFNRPDNIMYEYLNLFISYDSGNTWVLHNQDTGMGVLPDSNGDWTCVIDGVPMNATYALSTIAFDWRVAFNSYQPPFQAITPLIPQFTWPYLLADAQYTVAIATDEEMTNILYVSPVVSDTTFQMIDAFAPETTYFWVVNAASPFIGGIDSYVRDMQTRPAITCFLPTTAESASGNSVMFYIPAFIDNLLPGEQLTVTPISSEHLICSYED
ncbi:MAG: hypothetical protein PHO32_07590, partial [Candidatus Cloacimonetes bacterium]|nr:hypothetical protein [Candidatus Cloacimonadota bacterium]